MKMEIFKLFEATIPNTQPDHPTNKKLRRDELLDSYDTAAKTLDSLIKAKENELAYRRSLIDMLEKSKNIYNDKLMRAKDAYQLAKKHAPDTPEFKGATRKSDQLAPSSSTSTPTITTPTPTISNQTTATTPISTSHGSSDFDIPMPSETAENRSSLDRRLSEFLKTFPNLTQAGLAPPAQKNDTNSNNNVATKPQPGYYTQQPPLPPPISATAPPIMAMMRFPPPPMIPPTALHAPPNSNINPASQENHDQADMDLSDHEESGAVGASASATPIIPMIANALQRGAGGHINEHPPSYIAGQQFNQPIQYAPRINSLPFDPSIMEPRLRESSSSSGSGRDKHSHSPRGSHRGSSTGSKHGSDKNKYSSSSSHSSSRNKRR